MVSADGRYSFEDCVLLMICLADSAEILLISCGVLCRKDKTMFLNRFFGRICAACVLVVVAAACDGGSDAVSDYGFDRAVYHPRHSGGFCCRRKKRRRRQSYAYGPYAMAGCRQRGRCPPSVVACPGEDIPAGYTGQVVDGRARRIVAMSTTQIAMLATADSAGLAADISWDFRGCVIFPTIHCAAVSTIAPMLATKEMWIMKNSPRCLPTLFCYTE